MDHRDKKNLCYVWFAKKNERFVIFCLTFSNQKKIHQIKRKIHSKKNFYMTNQYYYYFDLPKIIVSWAHTTKRCLRLRNINSIFVSLICIDYYQNLINISFVWQGQPRQIKKPLLLLVEKKVQQSSLGIFIPCIKNIPNGSNFWLYRAESHTY